MNLERLIGYTLRTGVILSSLLVVIGSILYFVEGDTSLAVSSNFGVYNVLSELARGDPLAIIFLGVIVLIATPVVRVFELFLSYAWERDKSYILLSFLVLFLMMLGIILLPIFH